MKYFILFLYLVIYLCSDAQNLLKELEGNWICNKIIDASGVETSGKFGNSGKFLQFNFNNKTLTILEAPFDSGVGIDFGYNKKDSIIDIAPDAVYNIIERKYKINRISKYNLLLETVNFNNKTIFYHFFNQNEYKKQVRDLIIIDYGLIVVKHLKFSPDETSALKVGDYMIDMKPELYLPTPKFKHKNGKQFGDFFSYKFKLPEDFEWKKISEEVIVEFDVTEEGLINIEIVKGLSDEIDTNVITALEKSTKKWHPLKINDKVYNIRNRIHFVFYLGELGLPKYIN